jgi:acyl-CoA synthetase (AMP-forming)/AMP-acid ligase II
MNVLGRRKAGAVGQVLNGVNVLILDSDGNSLPVGEEGEICCIGPNVMKGESCEIVTGVISISKQRLISHLFRVSQERSCYK